MSYKIAIASTDGKVVNQHFGKADQFYIVAVEENESYSLQEIRESKAVCQGGDHNENALADTVELLSDCRYVLVSRIGPGAEYALNQRNVTAFAVSNYIDEAVKKLIHYHSQVKADNK